MVTRLRGSDIKFNTGLTVKNNIDNANPPTIKVNKPP